MTSKLDGYTVPATHPISCSGLDQQTNIHEPNEHAMPIAQEPANRVKELCTVQQLTSFLTPDCFHLFQPCTFLICYKQLITLCCNFVIRYFALLQLGAAYINYLSRYLVQPIRLVSY